MLRTPLLILLLLALAMSVPACAGPSPREATLDSDNPAGKLYAIRKAAQSRDRSKIPSLVEQLNHDDPAVRMMAINALERMTGTRLGYNPYADLPERGEAVERWAEAVRTNRFEAGAADESP